MRLPTFSLLVLACLAGCASQQTCDEQWTQVQRDRLLRLYAVRDPDAALAMLRRQEPGAPQNATARKHLDQLEPVRPSPRRFQGSITPLAASFRVGFGTQQVKVSANRLDDRADAAFAQLRIDGAANSDRGPGVQLGLLSTDDDLFAGTIISNGMSPAPAAARVHGLDLFPHVRWNAIDDGDLAAVVRAGLFVDWLELDHGAAGVKRSWVTVGPRAQFEPQWHLFVDQEQRLDVFARLQADLGPTWFRESFGGTEATDSTLRGAGAFDLGLRYTFGRMSAELGYEFEHAWYGGVTSDLLGSDRRAGSERQQLFLGVVVRF